MFQKLDSQGASLKGDPPQSVYSCQTEFRWNFQNILTGLSDVCWIYWLFEIGPDYQFLQPTKLNNKC